MMKHMEAFKIPVEWFCIMIFFSLMIFRYPKEDYKIAGISILHEVEIKSSGGCQNASGVSAVSCWELPECGQFPV